MVIYEVNLVIDAEIAEAYGAWLGEHIEAILAIEGFVSADWEVGEEGPAGKALWSVRYTLRDRAALDRYYAEHAPRMRADGLERFGDRFSASRRVLELRRRYPG